MAKFRMPLRPSRTHNQRARLVIVQLSLYHRNRHHVKVPVGTTLLHGLRLPSPCQAMPVLATNRVPLVYPTVLCITCQPAQMFLFPDRIPSVTNTIRPETTIVGSLEIPAMPVAILDSGSPVTRETRVKEETAVTLGSTATLAAAGLRIWSGVRGMIDFASTIAADRKHLRMLIGLSYYLDTVAMIGTDLRVTVEAAAQNLQKSNRHLSNRHLRLSLP